MAITKVLITVKTYPSLSAKYGELVCTAGFLEDGTWIRLYPIPFRSLKYEEKYKKYQWIELDIVKNDKDFRPESFRPATIDTPITLLDTINTKGNWYERKQIALNNVHKDIKSLIAEAHNKEICTSLAVFKPTKVLDFKIEKVSSEWDKKKIDQLKALNDQGNLFEMEELSFEVVEKLPYKFSYVIEDENGVDTLKQMRMLFGSEQKIREQSEAAIMNLNNPVLDTQEDEECENDEFKTPALSQCGKKIIVHKHPEGN